MFLNLRIVVLVCVLIIGTAPVGAVAQNALHVMMLEKIADAQKPELCGLLIYFRQMEKIIQM